MKPGIIPVVLVFAAAAFGLVALRDMVSETQAASAETAGTETAEPAVTAARVVAPSATPSQATNEAPLTGRTAYLRKEDDGHYWVTAYVNDMPVRFLVDTGASVVALTPKDARRIGLNLESLPRNAEISTASGKVQAASAMLDEVKIDRVSAKRVQAVIIDEGLEQSLLGMTFLNQMRGWEVTPRAILIRQ